MRIVTCFCIMALFLVSLATPRLTSAHPSKPSAYGDVQVSVGDGVTRDIEFDAQIDDHGNTKGSITFTHPAATPDVDPDNPDGASNSSPGLSVAVDLDCLVVHENRAAMGGVVVDSNVPSSIGLRVLLTVEDNGEGANDPLDRLTWGVYENQTRTWIPSDAEVPGDQGASLVWLATDFERPDDVGVMMSINQSQVVDCESFPLSSYALVNVEHGDGNIQVNP